MSKVFIEDYIQKIILLEKKVGMKISYKVLEPFVVNSKDIISIQTAAKKIAEFINLQDFTFIVATVKQKDKVGGHIELKYGEKEIFIEISDDILKFENAVLATLSHEITHKYLHIHGISCGASLIHEYENEILTDIATVFLGLGKLMLNGCECQNDHHEYIPGGDRTITETLKSGYLDRNQLAFVYRLVCAMRGTPSTKYERGLSSASIQSLRECEGHYGYYFDNRFHESNIRNKLVDKLESEICKIQSILSHIDNILLYLQCASIDVTESFLQKVHERFMDILTESQKMIEDNEYNPCLKYLNAIKLDQTIAKWITEMHNYSSEASKYQNSIRKLANFIQAIGNPFLKPRPAMFTIVTCRKCGTKLRLPEGKANLNVTCDKCKYQFVSDTSIPVFIELSSIKKESLFKRIFNPFFRKK